MTPDPEERYRFAREAGVPDRAIHLPLDPAENERISWEAEKHFADRYGLEAKVKLGVGDDQGDFTLGGSTIDIKWTPRENGRLLVAFHSKPQDYYVLVVGPDPPAFRIVGFASRKRATAQTRDLGHGPGYVTDQEDLDPDVDGLILELRGVGKGVRITDRDLELGDFMG